MRQPGTGRGTRHPLAHATTVLARRSDTVDPVTGPLPGRVGHPWCFGIYNLDKGDELARRMLGLLEVSAGAAGRFAAVIRSDSSMQLYPRTMERDGTPIR
jgi:hypothetical protein